MNASMILSWRCWKQQRKEIWINCLWSYPVTGTQKKQQQLYDDKVAGYRKEGNSQSEAEELAKQWVSVPGYSEHQIGLAVDINGAIYDLYFWLQENSYKYGFIFRYPGDKTDITALPRKYGIIGMLALRPPQRCMKKGCAWRNIWQKGRQSNEKIKNRCFVWRLFPGI